MYRVIYIILDHLLVKCFHLQDYTKFTLKDQLSHHTAIIISQYDFENTVQNSVQYLCGFGGLDSMKFYYFIIIILFVSSYKLK